MSNSNHSLVFFPSHTKMSPTLFCAKPGLGVLGDLRSADTPEAQVFSRKTQFSFTHITQPQPPYQPPSTPPHPTPRKTALHEAEGWMNIKYGSLLSPTMARHYADVSFTCVRSSLPQTPATTDSWSLARGFLLLLQTPAPAVGGAPGLSPSSDTSYRCQGAPGI